LTTDSRNRRFELLAMPHLDAAFNLARWLTGNTDDAQDVVQDAYLRAFRYLDAFRGDNFRVWLLTIVRNSFLDWLKDNRTGRQLFQPAPADADWTDPTPSAEAGGLAGILLTLTVTLTRLSAPPDPMIADVVADHVRSLMADHLTDVATSDRHTVKPWLSARLDLSPRVKDFATEGFPLVGGRLDYVQGHRAAAIVYRRDKHIINLFAFVSEHHADAPPKQESYNGFNIIRWRMDGLSYIAVSDVEAVQLQAFVRLVESG
jgi:RNA polymerase sigma factor (sigma-70 family)